MTPQELEDLRVEAQAGDGRALYELGHAYRRGDGVARDLVSAESYYDQSTQAGYERAMIWHGRVLSDLERYDEALAVHDAAVALDVSAAARTRGEHHVYGRYGPLSDPEFGRSELERLSAEGDSRAMFELADALDGGSSLLPEDEARAFELYGVLAEEGNARAQERYGNMLRKGEGTEVDIEGAVEWLSEAEEGGRVQATFSLARLLASQGKFQDAIDALEGAREEDPEGAGFNLGRMHARGEFGPLSSVSKAVAELEALSAQGHTRSTRELARLAEREPLSDTNIDPRVILDRLDKASMEGDAWATISMLTLLRRLPEEFTNPVGTRRSILEDRGDEMPERYEVAESVRLASEQLYGRARYTAIEALARQTDTERAFSSALLAAYYSDRNAYTWILQAILRDRGLYQGPVNGLMTSSTIRSIRAACREADIDDLCSRRVLSSNTVRALGPVLASAR